MKQSTFDAAVIGAGAAGMAAAAALWKRGRSCALVDRESDMGGILLQCIHNGFGLHRYGEELTGPEFAARLEADVRSAGIPFFPETTVLSIDPPDRPEEPFRLVLSSSRGIEEFLSKAVILAMGSRERNRGNVRIPGDRPAGVFTAGLAQRLINIEGYIPGSRSVIVGSGDIGLIMARRLTLSGVKVEAVVELMPYPSGLARNIAQCLDDFDIPLYLSHGTIRIIGRERVEAVEIAPIEDGALRMDRSRLIPCDTVLLSVGLVPENELSARTGVAINPVTNGPLVDSCLMTKIPGIFAAGNVLHIHDLVDRVAEEAERAGESCADWLDRIDGLDQVDKLVRPQSAALAEIPLIAGRNVRYTVPSSLAAGILTDSTKPAAILLRSLVPLDRATVTIRQGESRIFSKRLAWVRPGEMIRVDLESAVELHAEGGPCTISLENGGGEA